MDGYKLEISMDRVENIRRKEGRKEGMDRSAQNCDRSSECEIMSLRRMKFVFDVAPLEIIDGKELFEEDEDFFPGAGAAAAAVEMNINQINLVIHAVNHGFISQYWSLKSNHQQQQQQQLQLNSSSSCRYQQHHRDHHHLRDNDDDEEMIMITCRPGGHMKTADPIILLDRASVFASSSSAADDYIMSQLRDLDVLYEMEWIFKQEQLEEVKRCIVQRISEAKPALLLLAKTKTTVRIRVDLSTIYKRYYANPAAAASAYAKKELYKITVAEDFAIHYPAPTFLDYDDAIKLLHTTPLKSSKEALETKILEEEDLISSSSSSSCSVCLNEFRVGVDEIKKMPCSHMFHLDLDCLKIWLWKSNTCPLCRHELPTLSRFLEDQLP